MRIDEQVCSVELAKKLKELGLEQGKSMFITRQDGGHTILNKPHDWDSNEPHYYSAFTVAELGDMLPYGYFTQKVWTSAPLYRWDCTSRDTNYVQFADTEADARAKMLVHLIESRIVAVE